ncbi:MAG: acyl-ACP--UDP-N-acetylglucosamine O-acyltransferase [Saprospiraceae bacterium]|nr:acyl-ACP--UDP-N-acetylglucosamine O-acyltransferase [Saprospiraceae bacterium]
MNIHQLSVIHPDAKIGKDVTIGPFTTIAADVVIGDGTWIAPHVSIMDGVRMGRNCKVFQGAIVGSTPQDLKYKGERTLLEIGDNTILREYCTVNIGTTATWKTVIGKNCLVMAYAHVAHDCVIGDNVVLANNVTLAGHIEIGDFARLGGMVAVHQFVKIGNDAFIGGGSLVPRDVPPFVLAARNPLSYAGVNRVGLVRRGFSPNQIDNIRDVYRILFVRGHNLTQAVNVISETVPDTTEKTKILDFVNQSTRGLIKGFRASKDKQN